MLGIKARIYGMIFLTMTVIAVQGWVGLRVFETIQEHIHHFSEQMVPLTSSISRLEIMQTQQNNQFEKVLLSEEFPNWVLVNSRILHDQFLRINGEIERSQKVIQNATQEAIFQPERLNLQSIGEHLSGIKSRQQNLSALLDRFLVFEENNNARLPMTQNRLLINESEKLEMEVGELLEMVEELLSSTISEILLLSKKSVSILIGAWLLSVTIGVGLAIYVARSILHPLCTAHQVAQRITAGDLEVHIPLHSLPHDELGQLLKAMNVMAEALRERLRLEHMLLESEKISSLGRLAMGLAHEINNPLANATLQLEMLRLQLGSCHVGLVDRLDHIDKNIFKAMAIAKDLLNFSRPQPQTFSLLNVHDALECVLSLLEHRLREVAIHKEFDPLLPEVLGIGGKLEQVFMNLIQNAIEAMPHGGRLVIRTHAEPEVVVVTISDSGPGIPNNLRHKVMETFFTTRHEEGGVGLGLTVCQSILNQHGGRLSLTDASEGGVAAVVRLPIQPSGSFAISSDISDEKSVLEKKI
ncbi:MAG: ATP-binding protein [Magnetococcus sp. DMHC-6]